MTPDIFIDYKNLVFRDYQQKKLRNVISLDLIKPTPASIKSACKAACELRFNRKDENCLTLFFGKQEDKAGYAKAITRIETDKFKPLANFLKGKTSDTEEKNIELLAWLIDFEQRPYEFGKVYVIKTNDGTVVQEETKEEMEDQVNEEDLSMTTQVHQPVTELLPMTTTLVVSRRKLDYKKAGVLAIILILLLGVGSYFVLRPKENASIYLTGAGKCMYWNVDHYEAIACIPKTGYNIVPLDSAKFTGFKKITTPDTITLDALGHVWYSKRRGELEFFTTDGYHPIEPQLRLKPISIYIINKYILVKKDP